MSETRKDEGNAGLTHSGPCTACGQTIPATPPAAETGEPVAWMYRKRAVPHGRPATDWLFTRDETEAEILARYPHNEVMRLYAAPAPREVSEAMVEAAERLALNDWNALDESQPERDENHENHTDASHRFLHSRLAHHLRAALSAETGTAT